MIAIPKLSGYMLLTHDFGRDYRNQVNAGLYVIEREAMTGLRRPNGMCDIARDLLPDLISRGLDLFGYRSPEYIKDAGTPERLDAVNADWESGRIARGSLSTTPRRSDFFWTGMAPSTGYWIMCERRTHFNFWTVWVALFARGIQPVGVW